MANKTATSQVSADSSTWGNVIMGEVCQRLPKIEPFIQEYRGIYSNQNGDGLGMIILEGGKAFLPVLIKEWNIQPVDVIVYKKGTETFFAYVSERNLLKLLTSSSLADPQDFKNNRGGSDSYINLLSPGGGYGRRTSNPFYGTGSRGKLASDTPPAFVHLPSKEKTAYVMQQLDLPMNKILISEFIRNHMSSMEKAAAAPSPSSMLVVDDLGGTPHLFTDTIEDGLPLSTEQLEKLFATEKNQTARMEKAASYLTNQVIIMGNRANHFGNVQMSLDDPSRMSEFHPRPIPPRAGIYLQNGLPIYVNPNLNYIDGTLCSGKALVVGANKFNVESSICYEGTLLPDGADLSQAELLPEARRIHKNAVYCLYDSMNQNVSVPFMVKVKMQDEIGRLILDVVPLYGQNDIYTIKFYEGSKVRENPDVPNTILYPTLTTRILCVPDIQGDFSTPIIDKKEEYFPIEVGISKGGQGIYSIKENNKFLGMQISFPQMVAKLVYRYGLSPTQSMELVKALDKEKVKVFRARHLLQKTNVEDARSQTLPTQEKEALDNTIKVARKMASFPKEIEISDDSFDELESLMEKCAAEAQQTQTSQASQEPVNQGPTQSTPQSNITSYLMEVKPTTKDTQDVIDQLTYYAMGQYKKEDGIALLSQIEDNLRKVENGICKLMLLVQFGRVPGLSYGDAKLLMSDVDSFLTNILSSRVLLKI